MNSDPQFMIYEQWPSIYLLIFQNMEEKFIKCFTCNVILNAHLNKNPHCPLCGNKLQKPESGPPAKQPQPICVRGPDSEEGKLMVQEFEKNSFLLYSRRVLRFCFIHVIISCDPLDSFPSWFPLQIESLGYLWNISISILIQNYI